MSELKIVYRAPNDLHAYQRNARKHSHKQISQIAASIKRFGFTNPILVDDTDRILAGHGRLEAAKTLGWSSVPTIRLSAMNEADRRAYVIADNKLALNAGWDFEILAEELEALVDLGFSLAAAGLSGRMDGDGSGGAGGTGFGNPFAARLDPSVRTAKPTEDPSQAVINFGNFATWFPASSATGKSGIELA